MIAPGDGAEEVVRIEFRSDSIECARGGNVPGLRVEIGVDQSLNHLFEGRSAVAGACCANRIGYGFEMALQ